MLLKISTLLILCKSENLWSTRQARTQSTAAQCFHLSPFNSWKALIIPNVNGTFWKSNFNSQAFQTHWANNIKAVYNTPQSTLFPDTVRSSLLLIESFRMRASDCWFRSPVNVFTTQIYAYLARAGCQLVMHIPCTHLREIRRWEELVPVSFTAALPFILLFIFL